MKKKGIIFSLILVIIIIIAFCLIHFFTAFKPGTFGDLELREDGTYSLKGCGFEEGTYEVSDNQIILYMGEGEFKKDIFKIKIVNVNKLQIVENGTNCPQYSDAVYKRS